jgi:hypothetical protein
VEQHFAIAPLKYLAATLRIALNAPIVIARGVQNQFEAVSEVQNLRSEQPEFGKISMPQRIATVDQHVAIGDRNTAKLIMRVGNENQLHKTLFVRVSCRSLGVAHVFFAN